MSWALASKTHPENLIRIMWPLLYGRCGAAALLHYKLIPSERHNFVNGSQTFPDNAADNTTQPASADTSCDDKYKTTFPLRYELATPGIKH